MPTNPRAATTPAAKSSDKKAETRAAAPSAAAASAPEGNQQIAPRTPNLELPAPVARRGIDEAQWRTLCGSLYPGARAESVLAVIDYCRARSLDPMKKPCHIVPMEVKVGGRYEWRDVVMAGIYEYRTTAMRTGKYAGHSAYEYGEVVEQSGVEAPQWCAVTIYRHHPSLGKIEFPVKVYFSEVVALKDGKANKRWSRAPIQMLTKCTEAAGLREAFPDEFGGTHTIEEMEGHRIESPDEAPQPGPKAAPRRSQKQEPPLPGADEITEGEFSEGVASEAPDEDRDRDQDREQERGPAEEQKAGPQIADEPERESQQDQRQPDPRIGKIVEVVDGLGQKKDAATVKLSTGFICSTRNAEYIASAKSLWKAEREVELVTTSSDKPNTMDRLDSIEPL